MEPLQDPSPSLSSFWHDKVQRPYHQLINASAPHGGLRWCFFIFICLLYIARVTTSEGGFYVITYGLCIHLLYLVLMMITPDSEEDLKGPLLATSADGKNKPSAQDADEFRPFIAKMPEFIVWCGMIKVLVICLGLTLFNFLDIPVFWPILVLYFIILFAVQMGGRVRHMIKFGYVPWNAKKPKFVPKNNV
ncbi:rer1 family-like protein [Strigomonas culicis]|uniref:Protein RER1 n=1 Tax=Strigomonas culicis TaxID=28005 RepID=S9W1D8_9TRYP|nr:rer1 family-like protein [Strigomonas culicis]EPY33271.1 rer1 family-like protein [Strigomonas culicis]|eukprot:EPY27810.1 rer1 family-like protein [Strigomonas culicis]